MNKDYKEEMDRRARRYFLKNKIWDGLIEILVVVLVTIAIVILIGEMSGIIDRVIEGI